MSYTTIQRFWEEVLGLSIGRSQVANVVQEVSGAFEKPYEALREALASEPRVGAVFPGVEVHGLSHRSIPRFRCAQSDPDGDLRRRPRIG